MGLILTVAARSEIGRVRTNQEDSYALAGDAKSAWWAVVCDGMGGGAAGEVASQIAVDTFRSEISAIQPDVLTPERLSDIAAVANSRVLTAAEEGSRRGMGTTLAAVVIELQSHQSFIVHVGDSRVYLIREKTIRRTTQDHNWGEDIIRAGAVSREDIRNIKNASALTRAVGMDPFPGAEVAVESVRPGDVLLLCSDGLTNVLNDPAILAAVNPADLKASVDELVRQTLAGGAPDNVTIVLAGVGTQEP